MSDIGDKIYKLLRTANRAVLDKVLKILEEPTFPDEILPRILIEKTTYEFNRDTKNYVESKIKYEKKVYSPDTKENGIYYYSENLSIFKSGISIPTNYMSEKVVSFYKMKNGNKITVLTVPNDDSRLWLVSEDERSFLTSNPGTIMFELWKDGKLIEQIRWRQDFFLTKLDNNKIIEMKIDNNEINYKIHSLIDGSLHTSEDFLLTGYTQKIFDIETINPDLLIVVCEERLFLFNFKNLTPLIHKDRFPSHSQIVLRISSGSFLFYDNQILTYYPHMDSTNPQRITRNSHFPHLLPPDEKELKSIKNLIPLDISDDLKGIIIKYLISDFDDTAK